MSKRMLVILGHPSTDSFCGALSETYVQAAKDAGHEVRLLRLYEGTSEIQRLIIGGGLIRQAKKKSS